MPSLPRAARDSKSGARFLRAIQRSRKRAFTLNTETQKLSLAQSGLATFLVGFYLFDRIARALRGFPYSDYWDEWQIVRSSQIMLGNGDLFTDFFSYGNLPIYFATLLGVPKLLTLRLGGQSTTAKDLLPLEDYLWGFAHADFLIVNRLAWAFVGLIGVFAVFLILRRISSNWLALAGAAFLILTPLHTLFSTRVTPDGLATSIAIGALGFGIYYLKEPRFHYLIASALLAGLAAATKYNYGTVMFVSLLAYFLLLSRPLNIGHLINFTKLAMVSLGGFLLAMPSAIVRPVDFIIQVGREVKHYQTGSPSIRANQSERWIGQLETQLSSLAGQWGSGLLVLALIGLIGLSLGGRYERGIFCLRPSLTCRSGWLCCRGPSISIEIFFLSIP